MGEYGGNGGRLRRLVIWAALAGVAAVLVWRFGFGPTGFEHLAERVGQEQADRMLRVVIPVALAKHCHDRYGEDDAMVQAVAEYIVRNRTAIAEMKERATGVGSMSDGEKEDLEDEAMSRVAALAGSDAECGQAAARVTAGEYDL